MNAVLRLASVVAHMQLQEPLACGQMLQQQSGPSANLGALWQHNNLCLTFWSPESLGYPKTHPAALECRR